MWLQSYPTSSFIFFVVSSPSPLYDLQWYCHIRMTATCGSRGSAYHRHDLFSHDCICWADKYWGWLEPDVKFQMTSLCCSEESQIEPVAMLPSPFLSGLASSALLALCSSLTLGSAMSLDIGALHWPFSPPLSFPVLSVSPTPKAQNPLQVWKLDTESN